MLNELEQLADKIARVLRHADALAAENQRLRAEVERLQAEAEIARTERDAMVADRSVLNARSKKRNCASSRFSTSCRPAPTPASSTSSASPQANPPPPRIRRPRMSSKQIEVNIAGQAYKFSVSPDNEAALREAAAMVDTQMMRIRNSSTTKGIERMAVMAAISIASDLLAVQRQAAADAALPIDAIRAKLADLNARADEALRQYGEAA